jgi:iron(III) transport system permease protein
MLALLAERGSPRWKTPVHLLSVLPIITPPFVVGLGLILLFGRAGIVNQAARVGVRHHADALVLRPLGLWLAQLFAFTPIACLIMRGVVAGVAPSLEEAAQTLRADRWTTFRTGDAAAAQARARQRLPRRLHREHRRLRQPDRRRRPVQRALDRRVLRHRRRAVRRRPRRLARARALGVRARRLPAASRRPSAAPATRPSPGKGDAGVPMRLPAGLSRAILAVVLPWLAFTVVVYLFAFAGGFVATWGRD